MRIGYTTVDSALGRLLVAATERGICFVSLGDEDGPMESELRGDYPSAEIRRDGPVDPLWVEALLKYLRGESGDLALPLDARGTGFQERVWAELRSIPYGSTRTYKEIATSLGLPGTAARAVGRACATNAVSLVIPCHRARRGDGGLAGYRWGLERKRLLIEMERSFTDPTTP
jgi:AraC family transcriptional regulator, regulatory protein of adaptative response / methylated-DNA-[protein]-cysteine methyltransferase